MAESRALSPLNDHDFGAIEAAVMETERGRWFLAQYAQRNRNADTNLLLGAIGKLESAMSGERSMQQIERVRFDLVEMAKTIALLKIEVATPGADGAEASRFDEATEALDAIVRTTESATSSILEAAEQIQEAAWALREGGSSHKMCDTLDRRAADIYTACAFQDLTAQRTQKVVRTLRSLEGRINALIDAWQEGGPAASSPVAGAAPRPEADSYGPADLSQSDIDVVIVDAYRPDMADDVSFFSDPDLDLFETENTQDILEDIPAEMAPEAVPADADSEDDLMFREVAVKPAHQVKTQPEAASARPALQAIETPGLAQIDQFATAEKLKLFS